VGEIYNWDAGSAATVAGPFFCKKWNLVYQSPNNYPFNWTITCLFSGSAVFFWTFARAAGRTFVPGASASNQNEYTCLIACF
jgi:hypothetical protein